ncbi:HNH endonuclease [Tateyamaria sp. SN6-1]|uniref:HNH endonuclease n=1 Tax=Tateyamaria sp. SN6-1 TaxID=3092148 RepID=UPI0039F60986
MAFGIFIHRSDSRYSDLPATHYQFPKQYLSRAQQCVGDWIVYYEPRKVPQSKGYFAVAQVQEIITDPHQPDMFRAIIVPGTYLDLADPVPFRQDGDLVERGLLNDTGAVSGRAQAAVRTVSPADFSRIIAAGLHGTDAVLPRRDADASPTGLQDAPARFDHPGARPRIDQMLSRAVRDQSFRKVVLRAYSERCAVTGLRLINGGGRAEAEAAHIRPVKDDGPDIVTNGLALSGTVHWMFDRGLIGLSDDLEILISRQANDPDAVRSMINETGRLIPPDHPAHFPRPEFVTWHRNTYFKQ